LANPETYDGLIEILRADLTETFLKFYVTFRAQGTISNGRGKIAESSLAEK